MYLERLSVFSEDNPYYRKGGAFNTASASVQMPNCTLYAYLRAFESTEAVKPYPIARTDLGFGNAKTWYEKTPLPKGSVLKAGSIACFQGEFGHVAFVESVIDKTHAVISQSQYDSDKSLRNYKYWERREVELVVGKATLSGIGKLIGFIYLPIQDIRVDENSSKDQIVVYEDMVNVRIEPEGDCFQVGCYCPVGIYDVLETRKVNSYEWYKIEENHWVREGEWLMYFPKDDDIEELKKENAKLKEELSIANGQLDEIRKIVC